MSLPAMAQHGHYGHYGHRGHGWAPWIGGAILGAVAYDIYHRPVVVQQQPVIVQQPPVVVQQQPATVYIDGAVYTKQWVQINGQWQEVLIRQ